MHVPDLARFRVHDRRQGRAGPLRLPHRRRGQVGRDYAWDSGRVSSARMGGQLFKKIVIENFENFKTRRREDWYLTTIATFCLP